MIEERHFYAVIQTGVADPIARVFEKFGDAADAAKAAAIENPGAIFSVFEPKIGHAYRAAEPRAENVYLMWCAEPEAPEPAPARPADYVAGATPEASAAEVIF